MRKKLFRSKSLKRVMSTTLMICMSISTVFSDGAVETKGADRVTVSSLEYKYSSTSDAESSTDATLNKTKYGSKKDGYKFTTGVAKLYASIDGTEYRKLEWSSENYSYSGSNRKVPVMTAGKKFPWVKNKYPYFETVVSTTGYTDITFSAYVGATKKGPRYYKISYAVGSSGNFKDISGATLDLGSSNKIMKKISATLPAAAEGQSSLKIRITAYKQDTIAGSYLYSDTTSGEAAIDGIIVQGMKKTSSTVSTTSNTGSTSAPTITFKTTKGKIVTGVKIKKGKKKKIIVVTNPSSAKVTLVKLSKKAKKKIKVTIKGKKITVKAKKKGKASFKVKSGNVKKSFKITVK